jgi:hypothetical protein
MRSILACVGLVVSSSCALGPTDLTEISSMGPTAFSGYTQGPGEVVRVRAFQRSSQQWVTIAQATSASVPDLPAGVWGGNPALYAWSVTAPIATRFDPDGHCFLNAQCAPPSAIPGTAVVRLMFELGSATSPLRAMVYDRYGLDCIGRRIQGGQDFDAAAHDCRSPSYPEVSLRLSQWWLALSPGAPTGPPVGDHRQKSLIAAVDGVTVRYSEATPASGWSVWRTAPGTAPVPFVADEAVAISGLAYAIGGDGRVYRVQLTDSGWPLAPVGTLTQVRSHLSVVTARYQGDPNVVWLGYVATDGSVRMAATRDSTVLRTLTLSGEDVVIVPDAEAGSGTPTTAVLAVVRQLGELRFYRVVDDSPPQLIGTHAADATGRLSNVIALNGALHLLYTTSSQLMHASVPLRGPFAVSTRLVHTWGSSAPPARSVLASVDTNLFTAWTEGSAVGMARWAPGGPLGTWVEDRIEGTTPIIGPLALVATPLDVEVVARTGDGRVRVASAAAIMRRRQVERELDVFLTSATSGCGSAPDVRDPTWLRAPSTGRTVSALGAMLWRFPVGFTEPLLRELGVRTCTNGAVQPTTAGRACELAKTNVVFSQTTAAYTCADGMYLRDTEAVLDSTQQLGRAVARALGIDNAGSTPTAWNAMISSIPLPALQEAHGLFTSTLPPNCVASYCVGLIGYPFEFLGPEESFSFALQMYTDNARDFRARAEAQRLGSPCSDVLWRKYEFIRNYVHHGAEFRGAGDTSPSASFCAGSPP